MSGERGAVEALEARFYTLLRRLHDDPEALPALLALWSHRDDVSTMNARGGVEAGWSAVQERWTWWASQGVPMEAEPVESLSILATPELAFTTGLEHHSDRTLRITHVYRCEQGTWLMVHRHADPLAARRT